VLGGERGVVNVIGPGLVGEVVWTGSG
jgi:hypothetical protein